MAQPLIGKPTVQRFHRSALFAAQLGVSRVNYAEVRAGDVSNLQLIFNQAHEALD